MGHALIVSAKKEGRKNLTEFEAKTMLQSYGIRCDSGNIAQSASGALTSHRSSNPHSCSR